MNETQTETEPTLQSVLPASAQEAVAKGFGEDFKSKLKLSKGINRHLVARAVDRVLLDKNTVGETKKAMGLVESEAVYVAAVIDEFRAWEAASKAAGDIAEKNVETVS